MIFGVAFSNDGTRVYTAGEQFAREWDAATGQELRTFSSPEGLDVYGLVISPDGERLALGLQDGSVALWDIATGEQVGQLSGHGGLVIQVVFSADGRKLATASFDKFAKLWDLESGQELATLYGNGGNVFAVVLSPDGKHAATAGGDGTMRLYTLDTTELITLARSRLTRDLTKEECQRYLHQEQCPAPSVAAAP
jgi:WD40 repeat protein